MNNECPHCGEKIKVHAECVFLITYRPQDPIRMHLECTELDTPVLPEDHPKLNAWHLKQLQVENQALKQRTDTLLNELIKTMVEQGASQQDTDDVREEFNLYETAFQKKRPPAANGTLQT